MENHTEEALLADNGESEEFAESLDDDELKKPLLTEIARKKHFKGKFEKSEELRKEAEAKLAELSANKPEPKKGEVTTPDDSRIVKLEAAEDKRQFGYSNGYDPVETDEIFAYAQGKGMTPDEVKGTSIMKSIIETLRAENKAKNMIPDSSNRATLSGGKTLAQITSDPDASASDKQAAFEERMSKTGVNSAQ